MSSSDNSGIELSTEKDLTQVGFASQSVVRALLNLKAPTLDNSKQRAAIQVAAVLDRSGSMAGDKLTLLKKATRFMVRQLQKSDVFSAVIFDDTVDVIVRKQHLDDAGKDLSLRSIESIQPGGCTNLSGALFKGLQILDSKSSSSSDIRISDMRTAFGSSHCGASASYDVDATATADTATTATPDVRPLVEVVTEASPAATAATPTVTSCLLFTDGLANVGMSDSASIVAAMKSHNAIKAGTTVFTFGFGSDHDANMMKALAETGKGMYYFVEKEQDIPQAFADCLGGLISVCAQDVCVRIEGLNACHVSSVQSTFPVTSNAGVHTIMIGDLYAEEERDIIVDISLPALPAPVEGLRIVQFTVTYLNVNTGRNETSEAFVTINRSHQETPPNQEVPMRLARQAERVATVQALEQASSLARAGRLDEARSRVRQRQSDLQAVMAARGDDTLLKSLEEDLGECVSDMASESHWRAKGEKNVSAYCKSLPSDTYPSLPDDLIELVLKSLPTCATRGLGRFERPGPCEHCLHRVMSLCSRTGEFLPDHLPLDLFMPYMRVIQNESALHDLSSPISVPRGLSPVRVKRWPVTPEVAVPLMVWCEVDHDCLELHGEGPCVVHNLHAKEGWDAPMKVGDVVVTSWGRHVVTRELEWRPIFPTMGEPEFHFGPLRKRPAETVSRHDIPNEFYWGDDEQYLPYLAALNPVNVFAYEIPPFLYNVPVHIAGRVSRVILPVCVIGL